MNVVEEVIVVNVEGEIFELFVDIEYVKILLSFDCSIELVYGEMFILLVFEVWYIELSNGLILYGIENDELLLVEFML